MKKAVVEINGKFYDAHTGALLPHPHLSQHELKQTNSPLKSFEGVQRHHRNVSPARRQASTYQPRTPAERTRALKRAIVKKPEAITTSTNTAPLLPSKRIFSMQPGARIQRANAIKPSALIHKFHNKPTTIQPKHAVMEVVQAPRHHHIAAVPHHQHHRAVALEQFMHQQLSAARSHEEVLEKDVQLANKKMRSFLRTSKVSLITAGSLGLIIFVALIVMQKVVPDMKIRFAAKRAGFTANTPGYIPSGFALNGQIHYSTGKITLNFASNADKNRKYTVTQQRSAWDSEALLSNVIASANKPYQTYRQDGLTIYLYDSNNATWVNNGIWYEVEGTKANLSTDQLVKLASSL